MTYYLTEPFVQKDFYAHYLSYDILETYVAFLGAFLWQLPCRHIFGWFYNFLSFMSAQVSRSGQNPPKICLHGNCHSTAPIIATEVPKVPYSQNHALACYDLVKHLNLADIKLIQEVKYNDIFGSWPDQIKITRLYLNLIFTKKKLLNSTDTNAAYASWNLGPHG